MSFYENNFWGKWQSIVGAAGDAAPAAPAATTTAATNVLETITLLQRS